MRKRPAEPERADVLLAAKPVADPLEPADRVVRDLLAQPERAGELRQPLDGAGRAERPPVVDDQRVLPLGVRQQDHQRVDVLPGAVDDGEKERRARDVRDLRVPAEVVRVLAREVEPAAGNLHLHRRGGGDPVALGPVGPARREVLELRQRLAPAGRLQQPDPVIIDHEKMRRLAVVGAAGGACHGVEERRAQLAPAAGRRQGPVVGRDPGHARRHEDEDGLLHLAERRRGVRALVRQLARLERHPAHNPPSPPLGQGRHHRVAEQLAQRRAVRPAVGRPDLSGVHASPPRPARRAVRPGCACPVPPSRRGTRPARRSCRGTGPCARSPG